MKLSILTALNTERANRRAAVVVTDMGSGEQRLVKGAAHVGGVIVVRDSARVRDALVPVYDAMGVAWEPASAGAIEDELPGATRESVLAALRREIAREAELVPARLDARWLAEAESLAGEHAID